MASPTYRAPREHGFWVLLTLALAFGFFPQASWRAAAISSLTAMVFIGGAVIVGKRIRKNAPLQAFGSAGLALAAFPGLWLSGQSLQEIAHSLLPLGVMFVAGTFAARAVLERAKKKPAEAGKAALASVILPAAFVLIALLLGQLNRAAALLLTLAFCAALGLMMPSAKRLKQVGIGIAVSHSASLALLLV